MLEITYLSKLNRASMELYGKRYEKLTPRQKQEARDWAIKYAQN